MLIYINWLNSHGYSLSCLSVLWCHKLYISHRRGFSSLENIAKLNPILHDKIEYEMGLRITPYSTKIQKYLEKSIFYQHKTNYCMGKRPLLGDISNIARLVEARFKSDGSWNFLWYIYVLAMTMPNCYLIGSL